MSVAGGDSGIGRRSLRGLRVAVAWCSRTRVFRRVGPVVMPPAERIMAVLTGGRVQLSGLLVPSLVLHTTGARSGEPRSSTLMFCPEPGGTMLVTGSNFARAEHPAWTANLRAHPRAAVSVRGRRIEVVAEPIADDDRDATWAVIERQWPGYRGYERTSGRVVRIFRLRPVGGR